jgi:thiamine pyrophosphokinase
MGAQHPGTEALVFAGGEPLDERWRARLPERALVVAADSGLDLALSLGRDVDLVVGDLDSVSAAALARARDAGARVDEHPRDKDATDLELALDAVLGAAVARVTVVGAGGGRLDHFLANVALLAAPKYSGLDVVALIGPARVAIVTARRPAAVRGRPGSTVTLLPYGGPCTGVATHGLRWPLRGEPLPPGTTRGVSNEMQDDTAEVSIDGGILVVVQPEGGV